MSRKIDIAIIGDLNIDLILQARSLPMRGGMEYVEKIEKTHGGVGRNIAIALSRLGLSTLLIGAVGDDAFGAEIIRELEENNVIIERVRIVPGKPTGTIVVIVDKEGERTMIGFRGANSELTINSQDLQHIEGAKHLHISGYSFLNNDGGEGIVKILKHSKLSGITTSIDLEGVAKHNPRMLEELRGHFDYVMSSEGEAKRLVQESNLDRVVDKLLNMMKANIVAVKLGARGAIIASQRGSSLIPPFQVNVLDTTGAGDAFNAGFLYGLIRRLKPVEAALIGNAMGAYKCMWFGARYFPTLDELFEKFPSLEEIRFQ